MILFFTIFHFFEAADPSRACTRVEEEGYASIGLFTAKGIFNGVTIGPQPATGANESFPLNIHQSQAGANCCSRQQNPLPWEDVLRGPIKPVSIRYTLIMRI